MITRLQTHNLMTDVSNELITTPQKKYSAVRFTDADSCGPGEPVNDP